MRSLRGGFLRSMGRSIGEGTATSRALLRVAAAGAVASPTPKTPDARLGQQRLDAESGDSHGLAVTSSTFGGSRAF